MKKKSSKIKTNQDRLNDIIRIDPSNLFIKYLVERIQRDDYRGWHVSQHNRYVLEDIEIIMQAMHDVVGMDPFSIPPGDEKDFDYSSNYENFLSVVDKINDDLGRGTFNSVKKNFFPDLDKMGFLDRTFSKSQGNITNSGLNFIKSEKLIDKYKIFTDAIDKLFGSKLSDLAELIYLSDYADSTLSIDEFMLILSDSRYEIDKIEMLSSFRSLPAYKKDSVTKMTKRYADPIHFPGQKNDKRDYHNWKNQAQQILNLLRTTVYFEVDDNKHFRLNVGNTGFFQEPTRRKTKPKQEYFKNHGINKRSEFELHHTVPISSARNKAEAKKIDDYRNLIYIHKTKHGEITSAGNSHVILGLEQKAACFSKIDCGSKILAENKVDALYSIDEEIIHAMLDYNSDLLKLIYEYESE